MRVLIMTDMEGVSGITSWDQVTGGKPMYEEGRAAPFRGRHGVEIVEPLKVVSRGRDWLEAWDQVWRY